MGKSVNVHFMNSLNLELRLKSESLAYGCYGIRPPSVIQPGQSAHWESETCFLSITGTEGKAIYEFTHDNQPFEINLFWDNPLIGSNSYSCSVNNNDYDISYTGGGGNDASVTFNFSKKNVTTLWYTKTDDLWHNSSPTSSNMTLYPGHLVPYKDKLFCFYQSEILLDGNNNVFYITKDDQSLSWSEPKPIKGLGDNNSGLSAILYYDKILIACRSNDNKVKLISYKDGIFSDVISYDIRSSYDLSLSIFNNEINLFFRGADDDGIWHFLLEETNNSYKNLGKAQYWASSKSFCEVIRTSVSPKTIVYQGLLYLIYATSGKAGWYYIKFDGERWSYPIHFTKTNYSHAPGLAVHNGLLKVAFVGSIDKKTNRLNDRVIYQYCYDGNSWSLPMPSSDLLAGYSVNMTSYKGELFAVYPGIGSSGITDDTVSPHDEL